MGSVSTSLESLRAEVSSLRREIIVLEQKLEASEAARQECDERFRDLAQNIQEVFWIDTPDLTKTLYVNPAYEEIWGCSCQSLYENSRSFIDAIHPHDRDRIITRIQSQSWEGFCEEYRIIRPNGEIRWIRDRAWPVRDESGKVVRVVRIAEEISSHKAIETCQNSHQRKEPEASLRATEQMYRQILNSISDMVFVKDKNFRISWANKALRDYYNMTNEKLKGILDAPFNEPEFTKRYNEADAYVLNTGEVLDIPEEPVTRHDGQIHLFHTIKAPLFGENKEVLQLVGVARDITERKQAESALLEANQLLALDAELGSIINKNLEFQAILQACTETLVQHLDAAFVRIWILNPDMHVLELQASAGLYTHLNGPHSRIPVGHLKIGQIAAEKKPHLTNAVIGDSRIPEQAWAKREGLVAFAGYPLVKNQEVVGVLGVFAKHVLTEGTLENMRIVCDRLAMAIERQQALREYQKFARQHQRILASAGEGIYGVDLEGHTTFVNPAAANMLGYEIDELIGIPMSTTVHHTRLDGSPYPQEECPIYAAFKEGQTQHIDNEIMWRKDGTSFPVEFTSTPMWEEGRLSGAVVTFQDITERKQAEELILKGERKFRAIYEQAPTGIAILDSITGRFTKINQKYCDIVGYSEEEMLDQTYQELTPPDDLQTDLAQMQLLLAGQIGSFQMEKRYIRKNGEIIWVNLICVPLWLESTDPRQHMAMVEDITYRKQAEKALQESEERFRLLNEAIPQQVWTARPDGSLDYVNQRVLQYFGCSFEEIIGQGWQRFIHPDDLSGCLERWDKARDTNQPFEIEFRLFQEKAHSFRWHLGRALPIFDQDGEVVKWFGTNTDITQFKQLENQIRQSQKMEAIGTLAGGIAHDFNNILMAITGYAELATFNSRGNDAAQRNLEEVLVAGQRAKELVQQILAFSRQTEHQRQRIELKLVVKEVCKLLRASLPTTVEIRQNFTKAPTVILGDPIQMHQVIMNLCANAEHAMRESGGLLELNVDHVIGETDDIKIHRDLEGSSYVRLTVRDTGAGMAQDVAERIFDPFFTTKGVGEGTGLGLAVVHGIVNSHGGFINMESEPGKGTIFSVYFPEMEAKSLQRDNEQLEKEYLMGDGHILFVEDEEALARLGKEAMTGLGYEVMVRTSSVEALEAFRSDPLRFDAVVTDQTMPNMTGEALSRALLQIRPDVPIILCTGFSHSMTQEKAKAMGVRAFLLKPLLIKDLGRTLHEVLHT